jgi:NADH-quinone oxidoreductase subunit M
MSAHGWITTTLILLPFGGALLLWLVPMPRVWIAPTALLLSLFEIGFWIEALVRFDFSRGGLQESSRLTWFKDLGVSYHVGMFEGFSVWLVGLTTVVLAASIAYGVWAGRDRARAYYGLMLFLTGAIVGVFTSQDLLLFYVFWEAMLIPLYVLIGAWGGPGRLGATIKFVIYTMVGSLLMLAAVIVYGLQQGTFSMVDGGTSSSDWLFLGFAAAFVV